MEFFHLIRVLKKKLLVYTCISQASTFNCRFVMIADILLDSFGLYDVKWLLAWNLERTEFIAADSRSDFRFFSWNRSSLIRVDSFSWINLIRWILCLDSSKLLNHSLRNLLILLSLVRRLYLGRFLQKIDRNLRHTSEKVRSSLEWVAFLFILRYF